MATADRHDLPEGMGKDKIIIAAKTMLIYSIILNNEESFFMALEGLQELEVDLNWRALIKPKKEWNSPLIVAAKNGRVLMFNVLLENGADPNLSSLSEDGQSTGKTALHISAELGQLELVERLLKHGCDIDRCDLNGWTPIHYAICRDNSAAVQKLLEHGANPGKLIRYIPSTQRTTKKSSLIFSTWSYKLDPFSPSSFEFNGLSLAAHCYKAQLVSQLLRDHFKGEIDCRSPLGRTALHEAVILPVNFNDATIAQSRLETVKILLEAGCNPNVQDYMGKTVLHVLFDHANLSKFLLREIDFKIIPDTILLVLNYSPDLSVSDFKGRTVAHQAAALGNLETMQILMESGVNLENVDNDGNTPFHVAAYHGNTDVLQYLLRSYPQVEMVNRHGETILHAALKARNTEDTIMKLVQLLKDKVDTCKVNTYRETAYDLAVQNNLQRVSLVLVDNTNADDTSVESCVKAEDVNVDTKHSKKLNKDNGVLEETLSLSCHCSTGHKRNGSDSIAGAYAESCAKAFGENHIDDCSSGLASGSGTNGDCLPSKLEIEHDTDVNEYLLKLCHDHRIGQFHIDHKGKCHERCEIAKQTLKFVQDLVKLVEKDDDRFRCNILSTGSAFEGYRVSKPDEFDLMCEITSLSDGVCKVIETEIPGFVRIQVKEAYKQEWNPFVSEEGFLDSKIFKRYFAEMLYKKSMSGLISETSTLGFNMTSYDSCILCKSLISTSKAGVKMALFWMGNDYRCMPVDIDVTPAIHFREWPKSAKVPPTHLLSSHRDLGYHIIPKSEGEDPLLWRLSFSIAELHILKNVTPVQGACYTALKVITTQTISRKGSPDFGHIGFLHTYVLKMKFFEELERSCDPELWNKDKLTERVCSVLRSIGNRLSQRSYSPVESYFLPQYNIIHRGDRQLGKVAAAFIKTTLQNIIQILQKHNSYTESVDITDASAFSMKFDLDSDSESDNELLLE